MSKGRWCCGLVNYFHHLVFTKIYHPYWNEICCDNSPLDIQEGGFPHHLHKFQNKPITFFISWTITSHHVVLPFDLSSSIIYLTNLGILNPYLLLLVQYFDFNFDTIRLFFSSRVVTTTRMLVTARFGVAENIHQATMDRIYLRL